MVRAWTMVCTGMILGNMPIALIRLGLTKQKLTRDMSIDWKFYGDLPAQ